VHERSAYAPRGSNRRSRRGSGGPPADTPEAADPPEDLPLVRLLPPRLQSLQVSRRQKLKMQVERLFLTLRPREEPHGDPRRPHQTYALLLVIRKGLHRGLLSRRLLIYDSGINKQQSNFCHLTFWVPNVPLLQSLAARAGRRYNRTWQPHR